MDEPTEMLGLAAFSIGGILLVLYRETTAFGAFCIGCLLTPLLVRGNQQTQELLLRPFDLDVWLGHFADPAMVAGVALMLGAILVCRGTQQLSRRDTSAANW